MALTIKTIVKIYLLFFTFFICGNLFIELMPEFDTNISSDNQAYLDFLSGQINGDFNPANEGNTLLDNFRSSLEARNLFNEGIINAFLGVLKVIGSVIWFLVQLALNILFVPGILFQIFLYNFVVVTAYNFVISLIINVFFYSTLFYIVFRRRTSQN